MKSKLLSLIAVSVFVFCLILNVIGQNLTVSPKEGQTPSGLRRGSGTVNPYNGTLSFTVPLIQVGGRGEAGYTISQTIMQQWTVDHRMSLTYSSSLGSQVTSIGHFYTPLLNNAPGERTLGQTIRPSFKPGIMIGKKSGNFQWENTSSQVNIHSIINAPGGVLQSTRTVEIGNYFSWVSQVEKSLTRLAFITNDGTEVDFRDVATDGLPMTRTCNQGSFNRGKVFKSTDGSSMTFVSDTDILDWNCSNAVAMAPTFNVNTTFSPTGNLYIKNGVVYRIENGAVVWMRDRNGNTLTFTETSVTDSIGRVVTFNSSEIKYKGTNGAERVIKFYYKQLQDALRTGETIKTYNQLFGSLVKNATDNMANTNYNPNPLLSAIELPDGRQYKFFYNSYGELARVEYPEGAAVEWDIDAGVTNLPNIGLNGGMAEYYNERQLYRRVVEERLYPNGGTGSSYQTKTNYSKVAFNTLQQSVTVETRDNSNNLLKKTKHYYHGDPLISLYGFPGAYNDYLSGREHKTEVFDVSGNNILRQIQATWQNREPLSWWASECTNPPPDKHHCNGMPANDPIILEQVTTLSDTNQVAKATFGYDQFNNQTDIYEYDFGIGTPGVFLRRSHTDFLIDANYNAHTGSHLKGLPIQSWVSSDINGNNKVSLSHIEYDNYNSDARHAPLVSRANVFGHNAANYGTGFLRRGNPTQTVSFADAANQTSPVYNSIQYDILGNPVKTIDVSGNVSIINYDDNFGGPNAEARTNSAPAQLNGLRTFAFATSAINPIGWATYAQFDYFTGAGVDGEDLNGIVSSTLYNDPLDRPTQTIVANNTAKKYQSTNVYDDLNRRIQTTSDLFSFGDNLGKSESFYDELGRTTQTRKYEENGGYVLTLTEYDALGRVKRVTNPYRPAQNEPQLWTTTAYDALSRPISITTPDNAVASTDYSGSTTTVTDQTGKKRRSVVNGIGQLMRVDEPDDTGNLGTVSSPNQPTYYQYNTLGKMVKVTQGVQSRFFLYDSLGRLLRVRQPEQTPNSNINLADGVTGNSSWTLGFSYDAKGNVLTALDAKGILITNTYDNLSRPLTRTYSDGTPTVTYSYDNPAIQYSKGKLTQVSNSISTSQVLGFDGLGRTLASRQTTDGVNYDSSYLYNLSGVLVEETYPSGRKVKNTFETDGDLSKVETQQYGGNYQVRAQNLSYASNGALERLQLGNGLWETVQMNSRLQVTQLGLGTSPTDTSIWRMNYDFVGTTNNDGNIKSQTLTTPGGVFNQTFVYDNLNRLKQAVETSGGNQNWIQNFSYDRYGNRIGFNQTINGQTTSGTPSVDVNTNRFTTGQGYSYDFAGNVVQDPQSRQFIFNGDNKQIEVKNSQNQIIGQYFYDGDGKRIKKTTNTETTTFVYSGGKLVAEYTIPTNSPNAVSTQYLGTDMLDSPRIITDQNAQIVSRRDFMPFGEDIPNFGARNQGNGYKADNLRQKFTGYQKDNETGLDFAEARYYNNAVGRFTAVDPLLSSGKSSNPQTFNRYSYTSNNPISRVDKNGLEWYILGGRCSSGRGICDFPEWLPAGTLTSRTKWAKLYSFVYFHKFSTQWIALDRHEGRPPMTFSTQKAAHEQVRAWNNQAVINFAAGFLEGYSFFAEVSGVAPVIGGETGSETFATGKKAGTAAGYVAAATGVGLANAVLNRFGKGGLSILKAANIICCFVAGTPIHTKYGLVAIEKIKVGDKVLSYNEKTKKLEYKTVVDVMTAIKTNIVKLKIKGEKRVFTTTTEHPFYILKARDGLSGDKEEGEWKTAEELKVGDKVLSRNGKWTPILEISRDDKPTKVYNFEVEENHNYYVGNVGVLSHNCETVNAIISSLSKDLCQFGRCVDFADAAKNALVKNGISGEIIEVSSKNINDTIISSTVKSSKGFDAEVGDQLHQGVRVGNIVYDNLNPQGVAYDIWINSFSARSGMNTPKVTPF